MRLNLLLSSKDMQIQLIMVIWRRGEYLRKYPQLMNKKRKYFSFFLQTWSTNASNFRAKKILKSFGVSCDIYWQSYWSIFRYCYLSYWMFETNFWEVPSRFCIFGSVSERITWGEHPHQSMVLGHVHFKNTFFTECLQSENNTCWQKNLQQFQALFSMFVVKWCGKQKQENLVQEHPPVSFPLFQLM